jgi:hypothetical protein
VGVRAQVEGNSAIVSNTSGSVAASEAYIDAAPFASTSSPDVCAAINSVFTSSTVKYATTYPNGAVIDARGVLPLAGQNLKCNSNPFANVPATCGPSQNASCPSTILLPGQVIAISTEWILPSNTRIIGEGSSVQNYTTLGVFASGFPSPAMIQMGVNSSTLATGVVIEHLQLNGGFSSFNFDGIDNVSAGDGSYVDDVFINNIGADSTSVTPASSQCGTTTVTGLCIGPNATYSGPYTNLNISPPTYQICEYLSGGNEVNGMCKQTACVKIQAQTRGLHGITCVSNSTQNTNWPLAAIYLDSYSTSIEDVHVEGFKDAIVVGDYADGELSSLSNTKSISGNTISNVVAANGNGPVLNAVHICNPSLSSGACTANTAITGGVNNVAVFHALNNGGGSGGVTSAEAVQDDNFSATTSNNGGIVLAGLYAVGQSPGGNGYARFTTMPGNSVSTPTWIVGPNDVTGTTCNNNGAVFSNTSTSAGATNTIFVCSGGTWLKVVD